MYFMYLADRRCCDNCTNFDFEREHCEKSHNIYNSLKTICNDYNPKVCQLKKEKADEDIRNLCSQHRMVLKDIKDFLADYDPENYEDGSEDVEEIFEIVYRFIHEVNPQRIIDKYYDGVHFVRVGHKED